MVFYMVQSWWQTSGHFSTPKHFAVQLEENQSSVSAFSSHSSPFRSHPPEPPPTLICMLYARTVQLGCPSHISWRILSYFCPPHRLIMGPVVFASASYGTSLSSIIFSLSATGWLWISHLICQPPPPHLRLCPSSSIATYQHKRAEQEVAPLRGNSSSLISTSTPPSLAWDSVTFIEGGFISSLFLEEEHWREWRAGRGVVVRGGFEKGEKLKNEAWELRHNSSRREAQKRRAAWEAGRME